MAYDVQRARMDGLKAVKEFFKKYYRFNPLLQNEQYLRWQFAAFGEVLSEKISLLLLKDKESIVGCLGYVPVKVRTGKGLRTAAATTNWLQARRDGSGISLLYQLAGSYTYLLHLGMTSDSQRLFRALGVHVVERIPRWIGIMDIEDASSVFRFDDQANVDCLQTASRILVNACKEKNELVYPFSPEDDDSVFELGSFPSIQNYVLRDQSYLRWRYLDIPFHDYKFLRSKKGGLAVYRVEQIMGSIYSVVRIVEWTLCGLECRHAISEIMRSVKSYKCIMADFYCSSKRVGAELEKIGFISSDATGHIVPDQFRPLNTSSGISLAVQANTLDASSVTACDYEEWYITKGDSDVDRLKM